ncbi:MAG: hypothetical protein EBX65_09335, partial [Betaproteobacteria bacterium]|nr:hypothetical protein [Betaproteobacteria bacterium]
MDLLLVVPVHQETDDELRARYRVQAYASVKDQSPQAQADFFASLSQCQIAVTTGSFGMKAAMMQQLPSLRLIACFGVGVDGVDLNEARSRSIAVTNTPDVLTEEVADFAIALLQLGNCKYAIANTLLQKPRPLPALNDDVLDLLTVPGIQNMDTAIASLDDRGIGVFGAGWPGLED